MPSPGLPRQDEARAGELASGAEHELAELQEENAQLRARLGLPPRPRREKKRAAAKSRIVSTMVAMMRELDEDEGAATAKLMEEAAEDGISASDISAMAAGAWRELTGAYFRGEMTAYYWAKASTGLMNSLVKLAELAAIEQAEVPGRIVFHVQNLNVQADALGAGDVIDVG